MRMKGVDQKVPLSADLVTGSLNEPAVDKTELGDTPPEVRALQRKNSTAASRATPETPSAGDGSIAFFTAHGSYEAHLLSHAVRRELAAELGPEAIPFFELYYRMEQLA